MMAFLTKTRKEVAKLERLNTRLDAIRNADPEETERKRIISEKAKKRAAEKETRCFTNRKSVAEWEAIGRLPPCPECGVPRCHM